MEIRKYLLIFLNVALIAVFFSTVSYADTAAIDELIEDEDYSEAIEAIKSELKTSPDNGELHLKIGKAYNGVKEYELAQRHLQRASELGISKDEVAYDRGIAYQKLGYYAKAIEQFNAALIDKDVEARAYFGIGFCNYKLKKYDTANVNLDMAMGRDPRLMPKVRLYKGIIKSHQKNYDEALKDLRVSLNSADDTATMQSARNYISMIRKIKRNERDYMLIGALSFIYDDNVLTVSDSEPINISDKSDIGAIAYLRGAYFPIRTENDILLFSYMFYQKAYDDLNEFDLQDHNLFMNYTSVLSNLGALSLKYNYDYYSLNGDRYFQKNAGEPTLRINETNSAYLDLKGLIENKEHFSTTGLSSTNIGAGITQTFECPSGAKLSLSFDYNDENTRSKDFDYKGQKLNLTCNLPLLYGIDVDLIGEYYKKKYANVHSAFGKKRNDEVRSVLFRIKRELSDFTTASLRYDYTLNDSNIRFYDYTRNLAYIELKFTY